MLDQVSRRGQIPLEMKFSPIELSIIEFPVSFDMFTQSSFNDNLFRELR